MLLVIVMLFAQVQVSHFVRPTMPARSEWKNYRALEYDEEFTVPKSGKFTLEYDQLYPATYDGKTVLASPTFRDRKEAGFGNQVVIYDIDESFDHITIQAKRGVHLWYHIIIAVPK